jgi:hypothetical protein
MVSRKNTAYSHARVRCSCVGLPIRWGERIGRDGPWISFSFVEPTGGDMVRAGDHSGWAPGLTGAAAAPTGTAVDIREVAVGRWTLHCPPRRARL